MRAAFLGLLMATLCATSTLAAAAPARPGRVVSLNLCADQYVVRLAERSHIASLSPLAVDPELSAVASEAADLPRNRGRAEDVILLGPDLVIAGETTDAATLGLLRRLGIPLIVRLRVLMLLSGSYDRIRGIHRGLVGPVLLR